MTLRSGTKAGHPTNVGKRKTIPTGAGGGKVKRGKKETERVKTDQVGDKPEVKIEFSCSKFKKGFSKENQQEEHEVSEHVVQGDLKTCDDRKLRFANEVFYSDSEEEPSELKTEPAPGEHEWIEVSDKDDQYFCSLCNKAFTSKVFKTLHKSASALTGSCSNLRVDPDHGYTCSKCDKTEYRKDNIKQHEQSCKSTKSKMFECSKCDRTFVENFNLKLHETICCGFNQNPEKPFICPDCGKGFTRKDATKSHELGCNSMSGQIHTEDSLNLNQEHDFDIKSEDSDKIEVAKSYTNDIVDDKNEFDEQERVKTSKTSKTNKRPLKRNVRRKSVKNLDKPSSTLSEAATTNESLFQPIEVSTPNVKTDCHKKKQVKDGDLKVVKSFSDEFNEKTVDNYMTSTNVASDTAKYCDIDQLLESDDETEPEKAGPDIFAKDDIVWEMWYSNAVSKGRVADGDLNTSPPLVIAQLCVVTSIKRVKGKGEVVGLLPVPTDGRVLDLRLAGHTGNTKFVRKFNTLVENKLIVNSQRYRKDFQTVVEQVDCVERYLTNHVGLETVPVEEVMGFRQFLGLEGFEKCIYLEGLRRMKKGLSKEIPHRGDSFDESLVREGVFDHIKNKEVDENMPEDAIKKKKVVPAYNDDSYMDTLDQEMKDLVSDLKDNWPLEWMKNKSEIAKLKRIMTQKKKCRRHELFMDSKQRSMRSGLPELIKTSNSSFMNIFGKKRESLDRDIRIFIRQNIFTKTMQSKDFDPRLTKLMNQSQDYGRDYVELVLYPSLFISWVQRVRNCGQMEADRFFQTVGQVVSKEELDRLEMEWLEGGKVCSSDSEDESM